MTGPIFTFGGIAGQVHTAEAQERGARAFYQSTILNAFRETNDALVGSRDTREQADAQADLHQSLARRPQRGRAARFPLPRFAPYLGELAGTG